MNIQSTNQPTFGKLYMPEYKTLVEKYGTEIATALETQRKPAEKAAKKWDVYIENAWKGKTNLGVSFRVYPKSKNNVERNLNDTKWGCLTPIRMFAKSIKETIKKEKDILLAETLVENNLAMKYEADSFMCNYRGCITNLINQLMINRIMGSFSGQKETLRDISLIKRTLAKHALIQKGDKDILPKVEVIMQRMIKKNVPLKPVMEDLQNIGMHMPISSEWYLNR